MALKLLIVLGVVLLAMGLWSWKGDRSLNQVMSDIATTTASTTPSILNKIVAPTPAKPATPTAMRTFENGVYVTTIYYTTTGFVPSTLELTHGEEVRFVNQTNAVMHVIGDDKASSQYYRTVNQPNTLGKGGTYQISLPEVGLFSYYNLNTNPRKAGQIFVK